MKSIQLSQKKLMYSTLFFVLIFGICYYIAIQKTSKYFIPNDDQKPFTQRHSDNETPEFFARINGPAHPNCIQFRDSFPHIPNGYRDGDTDLAFTMVVHKDPRQIARLMRMIHRPNNFYCIHLDRRSSEIFEQAVTGIAKCFGDITGNVQLVPPEDRVAVEWGDESVLRPQMICGILALKQHSKWTYLLNIVGQEFPLKTHLELVAAVKALNGSNLVEAFDIKRYQAWVHGKHLPLGAKWFKGTVYGAFRRHFLETSLISERLHPLREFLVKRRAFYHPDELFFSSLAYNPHLGLPGACLEAPSPSNEVNLGFPARFVVWGDQGIPCPTKFNRGVCILGRQHVQLLKKVPHLIANKFHIDYHPDAYDDLERWYFDKVTSEMARDGAVDPAFNTSVYAARSCSRKHI